MVRLRRAQIVNLVEHSYYSNIDFRRLGTVLDCFASGAVLSVDGRHHRGRDGEIRQYLTQLLTDLSHDPPRGAEPRGRRGRPEIHLPIHLSAWKTRRATRARWAERAAFRLENGKLAAVTVESDGGRSAI